MKSIHTQCINSERSYTVNQMNDISIVKVKPFIIELYNKEQSNKNKEIKSNTTGFEVAGYLDNDYDNLSLSISDKPENSKINPLDELFQDSLITNNQKVKTDNKLDNKTFKKDCLNFQKNADMIMTLMILNFKQGIIDLIFKNQLNKLIYDNKRN